MKLSAAGRGTRALLALPICSFDSVLTMHANVTHAKVVELAQHDALRIPALTRSRIKSLSSCATTDTTVKKAPAEGAPSIDAFPIRNKLNAKRPEFLQRRQNTQSGEELPLTSKTRSIALSRNW